MKNFFAKFQKPDKLFSKTNLLDIDDLYESGNLTETISNFKLFNYHRATKDGVIKARTNARFIMFMCSAALIMAMYFIITSAYFNYRTGKIKEFQDSFVGVIGLLGAAKLLCLLIHFDDHMEIIEELDVMFPRTREQQERMNMKEDFEIYLRRWRIKIGISGIAVVLFCTMPILIFILDPDRTNLGYDHYVIAAHLPYGLKQDMRFYPFISVIEFYIVCIGVNCMLAYDHCYQMQWYHILMHFKFINFEIEQLKLEETAVQTKADKVFKKISEILSYHCRITKLAQKCNAAHELNFLLSDMLMPATMCTFAFMSTITNDLLRLMRFVSAGFVLGFVLYDYMAVGEHCKQVTSDTQNCFYNINWPDGSQRLRKDMVKLLQYANKPFELVCYNLYTIDMVHFQNTMMMAYKMFTFLKSMF